jgi:hypothetical protein
MNSITRWMTVLCVKFVLNENTDNHVWTMWTCDHMWALLIASTGS